MTDDIELVALAERGQPVRSFPSLPEAAASVCSAYDDLYRQIGYVTPWIGYLALGNGEWVGTCGFKSPPRDGRVEIAYHTFPGYEGRGFASKMAWQLVTIALNTRSNLVIAAQTLPEKGASTAILEKLGFRLWGSLDHPEDGMVWEWRLRTNIPD